MSSERGERRPTTYRASRRWAWSTPCEHRPVPGPLDHAFAHEGIERAVHPIGPKPLTQPVQLDQSRRTPSEQVEHGPACLSDGPLVPGLRPAGARRGARGVWGLRSSPTPGARSSEAAAITGRPASGADQGTVVEHGLVVPPSVSRSHQRVSHRLERRCTQRCPGDGPREDPGDVGVDHGHIGLEGEGEHGPRRVRPDPGEGEQIGEVIRDGAVMAIHDGLGSLVERDGSSVVAETLPSPDQLSLAGRGGGRRSGKVGEQR